MKSCKHYCKDYQLEGMCKKYSNKLGDNNGMSEIKYCTKKCKSYENPEQLPGQLDLFDIIDNKTK